MKTKEISYILRDGADGRAWTESAPDLSAVLSRYDSDGDVYVVGSIVRGVFRELPGGERRIPQAD